MQHIIYWLFTMKCLWNNIVNPSKPQTRSRGQCLQMIWQEMDYKIDHKEFCQFGSVEGEGSYLSCCIKLDRDEGKTCWMINIWNTKCEFYRNVMWELHYLSVVSLTGTFRAPVCIRVWVAVRKTDRILCSAQLSASHLKYNRINKAFMNKIAS